MAALSVLALLLVSSATFKSYRDLQVGLDREGELRQQIRESESRVRELEERVTRLREDPAILEQLAR